MNVTKREAELNAMFVAGYAYALAERDKANGFFVGMSKMDVAREILRAVIDDQKTGQR